jgi:hypothetical protein
MHDYSIGDHFWAALSNRYFRLDSWQYDSDDLLFTNLKTETQFIYPRITFEGALTTKSIIKIKRETLANSGGGCTHQRKSFIGLSTGRWACSDCGEWLD